MRLRRLLPLIVTWLHTLLNTCVSEAPTPPHLVLLLDTSATMTSQDRIHKIHVALKGWIKDDAPEGIKISLWKFANEATELVSGKINNSFVTRETIMKHIPQDAQLSSCISCSIETVLENIKENATILLITDGKDKFLQDDLDDLLKAISTSQGMVISTIVGSINNMHPFEEISANFVNYVPDSNIVFGLLDVLQRTARTMTDISTTCVTLFEKEVSPPESLIHFEFVIDSAVSEYEEVCVKIFNWPYDMQFNLTHENTSTHYLLNYTMNEGYKKNCLLDKKRGLWKVQILAPTFNKFIALQVSACSGKVTASIDFDCWVQKGAYHPSICGYIHVKNKSISGVNTSVDITDHNGNSVHLNLTPLYPEANNSFLQNCISVRQYFNFTETNYLAAFCQAFGLLSEDSNPVLHNEQFTRVSWGGSFKMDKSTSESSIASQIKDLRVTCKTGNVILLEFTVPLHAVQYKLTISPSLYTMFSEESILLGTSPGASGKREEIVFTLPQNYSVLRTPLYVSVSASGKNGIVGEASDIVGVTCHYNSSPRANVLTTDRPLITTEMQDINSTTKATQLNNTINTTDILEVSRTKILNKNITEVKETPKSKDNSPLSIIMVCVILAAIILVIIGILWRVKCARKKKRSGSYYVQCQSQEADNNEQL